MTPTHTEESSTQSACPLCAGAEAYAAHPARCFCDHHFREHLVPMGICPTDLSQYRKAVIANLDDRCDDPLLTQSLETDEREASGRGVLYDERELLMEAADDLLAACEQVAAWLRAPCGNPPHFEKLHAAIAKARGDS